MITIRAYYPTGSKRSTRSALSRRAHGVYANPNDSEPVFVTFGYPGWLFKSFRFTKVQTDAKFVMPLLPTPAEAKKMGIGLFGSQKS